MLSQTRKRTGHLFGGVTTPAEVMVDDEALIALDVWS